MLLCALETPGIEIRSKQIVGRTFILSCLMFMRLGFEVSDML